MRLSGFQILKYAAFRDDYCSVLAITRIASRPFSRFSQNSTN